MTDTDWLNREWVAYRGHLHLFVLCCQDRIETGRFTLADVLAETGWCRSTYYRHLKVARTLRDGPGIDYRRAQQLLPGT